MKKLRVGSGSASWGDMMEPGVDLIEQGNINYLGLDHLAELTLSILQRWKAKDPTKGYIPDIIPFMKGLLPPAMKYGTKITCNSGGANPEAAAEAVVKIGESFGMKGLKIGVVLGDDLLDRLDEFKAQGIKFKNLDTGEEDIDRVKDRIIAANAYVGCDSIIEALAEGANVVITGRASDNALYAGPFMYEFGWKFEEPYWDRIGAAVTVGHIIECGACCSGSMSSQWRDEVDPGNVRNPIAEMDETGETIITKIDAPGGLVNVGTVKEHLVYEVHDPSNYLMPDGIADFASAKLEPAGESRVRVTDIKGKPRPAQLKVCMGYRDGFIGEGHVWFPAPDAFAKAQWAEKWMRRKLELMDAKYDELRIDYMGVNTLLGSTVTMPPSYAKEMNECGLRFVVKTQTAEEADRLKRIPTWLWTHGPIGSSFGVPLSVRPVVSLWPTLIPRELVPTRMVMKEVK